MWVDRRGYLRIPRDSWRSPLDLGPTYSMSNLTQFDLLTDAFVVSRSNCFNVCLTEFAWRRTHEGEESKPSSTITLSSPRLVGIARSRMKVRVQASYIPHCLTAVLELQLTFVWTDNRTAVRVRLEEYTRTYVYVPGACGKRLAKCSFCNWIGESLNFLCKHTKQRKDKKRKPRQNLQSSMDSLWSGEG